MADSKAFWWVLIVLSGFISLMALLWLLGAGPVEVCSTGQAQGQTVHSECQTDWNWGTTIPSAIFLLATLAAFVGSIIGLRGATRRERAAYLHADVD
jgi:hypothetical protein